jgi:ABC-type Fe3+/spermidine/putrescine transport system ATPase subunit
VSAAVELAGASVDYGRQRALADVDLQVRAGEFVTLLGPSGSGKTTALNAIAGFVPLATGDVRLVGESIAGLPPSRREIGIVFQSYALFPHMSVGDNVGFALRARRVPRRQRERRIREALELVRLEDYADRRPATLSGGQQQRVALARAIVFEPKVLLLDEPLAALDKQLREAMQIELKRLQRTIGITTIAVTHDQTEAMALSDRIAILRDGRVEQVATPTEAYARPASRFVATFLGEANLVPADSPLLADVPVERGSGPVLVRPEQLLLDPAPGDAAVRGVVAEAVFQGDRWRLIVEVAAAPGCRLVASRSSHARPVAAGDAVGIRIGGELYAVPEPPGRPVAAPLVS